MLGGRRRRRWRWRPVCPGGGVDVRSRVNLHRDVGTALRVGLELSAVRAAMVENCGAEEVVWQDRRTPCLGGWLGQGPRLTSMWG